MKHLTKRINMLFLLVALTIFGAIAPLSAFAKSTTTEAELTDLASSIEPLGTGPDSYAVLTIYSDPSDDGTGSPGSTGVHSFLTIENTGTKDITVGNLTNIAPGRTVSIGTWGNKDEHEGVWYNLESYYIDKYDAYEPRVSLSMEITKSELKIINEAILKNNEWGLTNNCASFSSRIWNKIAPKSKKVSDGSPDNPASLGESIASKKGYEEGKSVPYDYKVYYEDPKKGPQRSTEF